jgi:hypothetical protein
MKDLVTHEIFEELLEDEVSDEEDWEDFLPGLKQKQSKKQQQSAELTTTTTR